MENITVACMQPRFAILESRQEFDALARRFLRQAQAKSAQLCVFPELTGLMLAPPLISRLKLGLAKQADLGRQPGAGPLRRRLGRVAHVTAGALAGGLTGSLSRLLAKNASALHDLHHETFGALAREFGTAIVSGSLYMLDADSGSVHNRAYVYDAAGDLIGYQDKLHLPPGEQDLAIPGSRLTLFETKGLRFGVLIGRDTLYPELARLLALQGTDLIVGIAAMPGAVRAATIRSALGLRAEENQIYTAACFLLGSSLLDPKEPEDYCGQSAVLAPADLSERGDGVVIQAGSARAEGVIAATLQALALEKQRSDGGFRPRQAMNLGGQGSVLAKVYGEGLSIDQAVEQRIAEPPQALQPEAVVAAEEPESLFHAVQVPDDVLHPESEVQPQAETSGEEMDE